MLMKMQTSFLILMMFLTLDTIEKKLVELNLATKEAILQRKQSKQFGKANCFLLRKFKNAVKKNYFDFFPEPPDLKSFNRKAQLLFKNEGTQSFAPQTTSLTAQQRFLSEIRPEKGKFLEFY